MFNAHRAAAALTDTSPGTIESALEAFEGPAYLLSDPDLTLEWFNAGFCRSWVVGGGRGEPTRHVGTSILDAIGPLLSHFYEHLYREAAKTCRCALHRYACPSPSANRWCQQVIAPRPEGLAVVNALLFEQTRSGPTDRIQPGSAQCCHCRRLRPPRGRWAPSDGVYSTDGLATELCDDCRDYYDHGASSVEWLDV